MVDARNSLVHGEGADKSWKMALDSAVIAEIISNWYVDMFKPKGSAHILLDSLSGSTNSLPIINSE